MLDIILSVIFYILCGLFAASACKDFGQPIRVRYFALFAGPISWLVLLGYGLVFVIKDNYDDVFKIFKD
jgi:hypothetical protein